VIRGELDLRSGAGQGDEGDAVGAIERPDEPLGGVDGAFPPADPDVVRIDGDHHEASALRAGVGVELHGLVGRAAVDGAVDRDELRRGDAARLAVDGQREVAGCEIGNRPAVLVDDADVDRHQVDGRLERGFRRLLVLRRGQSFEGAQDEQRERQRCGKCLHPLESTRSAAG
jgi:hypothetical protein